MNEQERVAEAFRSSDGRPRPIYSSVKRHIEQEKAPSNCWCSNCGLLKPAYTTGETIVSCGCKEKGREELKERGLSDESIASIMRGLADHKAGRVKPWSQVARELGCPTCKRPPEKAPEGQGEPQ